MMADELLTHVATWVAANGSSVGAMLLWVSRPLREKLVALEDRLAKLEKALGDPRSTLSPDVLSPSELTRAIEELRGWREKDIDEVRRLVRDMQANLNHLVSDEEFRGFITATNAKTDKILETLGWIRGRLKSAGSDHP
jgi:hypothetical protein